MKAPNIHPGKKFPIGQLELALSLEPVSVGGVAWASCRCSLLCCLAADCRNTQPSSPPGSERRGGSRDDRHDRTSLPQVLYPALLPSVLVADVQSHSFSHEVLFWILWNLCTGATWLLSHNCDWPLVASCLRTFCFLNLLLLPYHHLCFAAADHSRGSVSP